MLIPILLKTVQIFGIIATISRAPMRSWRSQPALRKRS